ncbi:MAG: membrane dipeptidase [Opitutaceae bacterium]|jgi:membrane dipeptidase|nr:membrane dipeptidase [Opitutaceae bacterium]
MKLLQDFPRYLLASVGLATATALMGAPDPELAAERADWSEFRFQSYAKEIHDRYLTLDTHLDVPIMLRMPGFDISQEHTWVDHASQVDFPRMKKGGLDGGFFVIFVPQKLLNQELRANAVDEGFLIANLIRETVDIHADLCGLATSPEEALALKAAGKHVVFMGIENGYVIGRDVGLLEEYHELGVRYFGIVHTRHNDLGDSSTDGRGPLHFGLSSLGKAAVEECNRLGMIIDISHASDKTTWDVLEHSQAPVLASHSGSYAAYPHARNLNDALLKAIADGGGVVQMNVFSSYIMPTTADPAAAAASKAWSAKYRPNAPLSKELTEQGLLDRVELKRAFPPELSDISTVVDHIDHMVKVMGIDHIGLSGDFDGGGGVADLMDVGQMMNLTIEMLRRGYSAEDLGKMWGANVMRVLVEVQALADE